MGKKLTKAFETLGTDTIKEMEAMSPETLKKRIVEASEAMADAADKLEANSNYQRLRDDLKALSQGKRDLDKRQKAVILVALSLLNMKEES